jgi:hypothetical protein
MTGAIKNKALIERFGRYVEHRKSIDKSGLSFTEQLTLKEKESQEKKKNGAGTPELLEQMEHRQPAIRSSRRFQPPRFARGKTITGVQATRLARYAPVIESAARKYGVPVELICGVILQESGGNARAVSHCGAKGLMQLMPGTARRFGVTNSLDPVQNIHGGTRYLRFLLDKFKGNFRLALAGYNAGEHNVEKYGNKIPPFAETQAYVPNVLSYTQSMVDIFSARLKGSLPFGTKIA